MEKELENKMAREKLSAKENKRLSEKTTEGKKQPSNGLPTSLEISPELETLLHKTYYDAKNSASYSTVKKLYDEIKAKNKNITLEQVAKWLQGQPVYSLFKPRIKKFPRRKIVKLMPYRDAQADLVDLTSLASYNNGYGWLLCMTDVFSRYSYVRELKNHTVASVKSGFESIFEEAQQTPKNLQTDRGSELLALHEFWKQNDINRFSTTTSVKASMVERYQKTLETRIFKYLKANNTKKYIDKLQDIVYSINHTKSRVLYGKTPYEALNDPPTIKFLKQKFDEEMDKWKSRFPVKSKYKVGQLVRIVKDIKVFDRGYHTQFQDEVHKISQVLKNQRPYMYKLEGKRNSYYAIQLSPVSGPLEEDKSLADKKKGYYIFTTREKPGKKLRSGKNRTTDIEYLLKSYTDPSLSRYISQEEFDKLQKDGFLHSTI